MIETERLVLRPLVENDCPTIVRELNNFAVCKNLSRVPYPYHLSDAADFLQFVQGLDERSLTCAIALNSNSKELIGIVSYEFSSSQENAELGYWLSENHWRKGIMSEAVMPVVNHAFTISKLETLISCFHNDNPNSGRVLKKVGFREQAQCISFSKAQGKDVPVTNLQLTREKWKETHPSP